MLRDPRYFDPGCETDVLRRVLRPLIDLPQWFDPRSPWLRHDMLQLHPMNDAAHWGYPCLTGRGRNPYPLHRRVKFERFW